jgi:transposase-like protein
VIASNSRLSSAPAGYRFPREVIAVAVRWYLRYGLSYRDVEELLAERGIDVDHVTIYRWVQTFTPEFIDAARPTRHASGNRWFVDETYVKVAGRWTYLYRAVDQHGQVIDVLLSERRDGQAAREFFTAALRFRPVPLEVTTDRAPVYPRIIDELAPQARPTCSSSTPTTGSKLITADSKPGCGRCADSNSSGQQPLSLPGTHSYRTCTAAITSSPQTYRHRIESASHSPISPPACDTRHPRPYHVRRVPDMPNATKPARRYGFSSVYVNDHCPIGVDSTDFDADLLIHPHDPCRASQATAPLREGAG